ncbi:Transcription elongation factor SPT4 [Strongyloides ratti]|uniref:Transcription elongation factor SPT4 n=1 Tax=Strongyloides ratti TaxID=34506 RepID=A0A090LM60_STRRB|nr:Transcription elongation factor SPT4 [Strongyloides ratti]CEF70811.1 Transcription elongation factor SPT4 [Strongyloides ratti]
MMDNELVYDIDIIPKKNKNSRACLLCGLVKSVDSFMMNGCDNCEDYLMLKGDEDRIRSCTSVNHNGTMFIMNPLNSFLCKYYNFEKSIPGQYAISVCGTLPDNIIRELRRFGIKYTPHFRDNANM